MTQTQMWAIDRLAGDPAVVNLTYALDVLGPLDVRALESAIDAVRRRHEPLRSLHPVLAGDPISSVADVGDDLGKSLQVLAVDGWGEAAAIFHQESQRAFDLLREYPSRAILLRLQEERHVLLLNFHHICIDGWGLDLFAKELTEMYSAGVHGRTPRLALLDGDCIDHARWQQRWLGGEEARVQLEWWLDHLRSTPAGRRAETAPAPLSVGLRRRVEQLPTELTDALKAFARHAGVSPYAVFSGAFQALLVRWPGQEDQVMGFLAANRPTARSSAITGAHYNVVLMPSRLSESMTLAEVVEHSGDDIVQSLDRQYLPYPTLARHLEGERGWRAVGDAPTSMLLQECYRMLPLRLEGLEVVGLHLTMPRSDPAKAAPAFPDIRAATTAGLTFCLREVGPRITLSAVYAPDRHRDDVVAGAVHNFVGILRTMLEAPETRLSEIPEVESWTPPRTGPSSPDADAATDTAWLHPVTGYCPAETLSPVGCWSYEGPSA